MQSRTAQTTTTLLAPEYLETTSRSPRKEIDWPQPAAASNAQLNRTLDAPLTIASDAPGLQPPLPGEQLGHYRLLSLLGQGSTGRVFAAQCERTRKTVALKLLDPALVGDRAARQRFANEAQTVRRIRHPNIVEISALMTERGHHFLVMELLRGQTLETLLATARRLPTARALRLAAQVCDALAAAHAVGVVHRDLKPGNIFILRDRHDLERAMLIDFGVAKVLGFAQSCPSSRTGLVIGTPAYMAPEQTRGDHIDHRVDIYALGVLIYEMLTGQVPFVRRTLHELIDAQRHAAPLPPGTLVDDIPQRLEQLVLACLAKDPLDRPVSMADVESVLAEICAPTQCSVGVTWR